MVSAGFQRERSSAAQRRIAARYRSRSTERRKRNAWSESAPSSRAIKTAAAWWQPQNAWRTNTNNSLLRPTCAHERLDTYLLQQHAECLGGCRRVWQPWHRRSRNDNGESLAVETPLVVQAAAALTGSREEMTAASCAVSIINRRKTGG